MSDEPAARAKSTRKTAEKPAVRVVSQAHGIHIKNGIPKTVIIDDIWAVDGILQMQGFAPIYGEPNRPFV